MRDELIDRLAFAVQDDTMTRQQARRLVRTALAALQPGDVIGRGLAVSTGWEQSPFLGADTEINLAAE